MIARAYLGVIVLLCALTVRAQDSRPSASMPTVQPVSGKSPLGSLLRRMAGPAEPESSSRPAGDVSVVVSPADLVEMHVTDAPLASVLRMLSTQSRRNIVSSPKVSGQVTADLYNVTFHQALDCILMPNDCTYVEEGNFIYVYTRDELSEKRSSARKEEPQARLFRLRYASIADVKPIIEPLLSKEGKISATPEPEVGLPTASETAGGNQFSGWDVLVVFDVPSRLAEIEKVLKQLDTRPRQVLVEATILQAQLNENTDLGVDFNFVGGVDFEMLSSSSDAVTNLNTGSYSGPQMNNTSWTTRTDFNDLVPDGGFTFGIIKDQISVFLRALETVTETTVLANPKVIALNKQRGVVIVGRRDGYITTTLTETTATQTVEYLETGTQLVFRPFICDNGYIRMEIHPKDSTGGLNAANLPTERTTEVTTNIMVRDGHTILIGGLFRESTNVNRSQVPGLGNIPLAGVLFQHNADTTNREEVIILLTVRIIKDDEYARLGDHLAEETRRTRIGARRGLQFYGRNRMAMLYYQSAVENAQNGKEDRALCEVLMALHLNHTYHPALELLEKLHAKDLTDDDAGAIRDFINQRLKGGDEAEPREESKP